MIASLTATSSQSEQKKITIMVIVVVGVFLVCNTLECIWWILHILEVKMPQIFYCTSIFTKMLNSSGNVIIYATFGKKFRDSFSELFCGSCQSQEDKSEVHIPLKALQKNVQSETMETALKSSSAWVIPSLKCTFFLKYRKVASSNKSRLEAHEGFSDCIWRRFFILMYCDLLTKSWFPN